MSRYLVRVFKVGELLLSERQYHDLMKCFAQHERVGYQDGASRFETAEIVEVGETQPTPAPATKRAAYTYCPKCGTSWTANEKLPCPRCQVTLDEVREMRDALAAKAAHSMVVEKVPEKGELRSARGFEEWWDNWILGQKKPYNALTKTDMEICWKSAQREVALAGEPSESAALAAHIGDRVRFIGTAEDDDYHGELCGKVGVIKQLYPFIGVDFNGDGHIFSVAEKCIEPAPAPATSAEPLTARAEEAYDWFRMLMTCPENAVSMGDGYPTDMEGKYVWARQRTRDIEQQVAALRQPGTPAEEKK